MIILITGTPGSGKSYEAVAHHILPALNSGRKVITNLPFRLDYYMKINPSFDKNLFECKLPTPENLRPFSKPEDFADEWKNKEGVGPLYLIDEAHMCYPRGDKDKPIFEYFTMHRHTGADIVLVTQQLNQLRREISGLIELSYVLKKNTVLGSSKSYRKQIRDGTKGSIISTSVPSYNPMIFKLYQSYTLGGQAEAAQKMKPIWFKWPFLAAAAMFLYVGYSALTGGLNPFGDVQKLANPKSAAADAQKVPNGEQKEKFVMSAPPEPASDKSISLVANPVIVSAAPIAAAEKPIWVEPFDLTNIDDQTSVRVGGKCRITLHAGGKKIDTWLLNRKGYEVTYTLHEGSDRLNFGGCTMTVKHPKSEQEHVFHANKYAS